MTEEPNWMDIYLPYFLHGDGARFTQKNSQSLLTVQWKPVLAKSHDCAIFPCFAIPKAACTTLGTGHSTKDELWKFVVEEMTKLFWGLSGDGSSTAGKHVCDGRYKFVCWGLLGDLEYFSNELRFPHFNSNDPCWLCSASRNPGSAYPLTDMRPTASWKNTVLTAVTGCAHHHTPHLVAGIPGIT
eukprot:4643826-Lingulodinium_polyedra.AAC.1